MGLPETFHIPASPVIILAGVILLAFGRKLFWFFVGVIGFAGGMYLGRHLFDANPDWALWGIALALGLGGALLALVLQKLAIGAAGFLAGGFFVLNLSAQLHWTTESLTPVFFVAGGILGALLTWVLFEWALIFLSSATGAYLIGREIHTGRTAGMVLVAVLALAGIIIQFRTRRRKGKPQGKKT